MKIENLYVGNPYSESDIWNQSSEVIQTDEQQKESRKMIDHAVSMEISRRGFAMAQELEAFDGEDVYNMRVAMTGAVDNSAIIDGSFVGKVAEQYKSMADNIREKYSGSEYERQMGILDKAYSEASESLAMRYSRQMRILSGDIVINREVKDYTSREAAQKALESDDTERKTVISQEAGKQISDDVKRYMEAARSLVMDKGFFDWKDMQNVWTGILNQNDLQKMGTFFLDKKHQSDISGISAFASEIISAYTNR